MKTINNNDMNHVADQRFSLKQWVAAGDFRSLLSKNFLKFTTMGHFAQCAKI